jgi:aryl-alcohol dehydrogenase-like predicted oxidoreductase
MNKIALGSARWGMAYGISSSGEKVTKKDIGEILKLAKKIGIKSIDTAPAYGTSEVLLGEIGIDDFDVTTKTPKMSDKSALADLLRTSFLKSKSSLGANRIYGLLIHDASDLFGENGKLIVEEMQCLKKERLVKKIGLSVYTVEEAKRAFEHYEFDLIQFPHSILDRRFERSGLLEEWRKYGVETHARSIFLQGLLLMDTLNIPKKLEPLAAKSSYIQLQAKSLGLSTVEYLTRFAISCDLIDKLIIGVESVRQLEQIRHSLGNSNTVDFPAIDINDEGLLLPYNWDLT